jgi:putative DNA primase/helicase
MLKVALAYAERFGWAVFPVGADCRQPLTKHGVYDASSDPATITTMFRQAGDANIALACGQPSGVLVLDIDCKGDIDGFQCLAELEDEHGFLPETPKQRSPSGGEHLFFAQPIGRDLFNKVGLRRQNSDGSRTVYAGLDIRTSAADGVSRRGSVALTPSQKPNGPYSWVVKPSEVPLAPVPDWLLALIDPPAVPVKPMPPIRGNSPDRVARYVEVAVDGECAEVSSMKPGSGRNQRLYIAAANLGSFVGAQLLPQRIAEAALERAADACGLVKEDGAHAVRATILSGVRKGILNPREVRFER